MDRVRTDTERGATAVEMALVAGLLFVLIFGIVEVGLAFRTSHTVDRVATAGARAASIGSNTTGADHDTLQAVRSAIGGSGVTVDRIVVYRADDPTDAPSASCRAGTPSGGADPCNVYTLADVGLGESAFGCGPTGPDRFWCPADRVARVGALDLVGVWVQATHSTGTGVFGDAFTFTAQTVLPVEPAGDR